MNSKKRWNILLSWALAIVPAVLLFPSLCWAAPQEVTLFPSTASVTEITRVALQPAGGETKKAVLILPATAEPDTLVTRLTEGTRLAIMDQRWQKVSLAGNEKITRLRRDMQELREARNGVQAMIQSLDTQVQFWQLQTKAKVKTTSDAQNMATVIGKNIRRLAQEKMIREGEIEKIDKRMGELQEELNRIAGMKESAWEVTVLLTGTQKGEVSLTYTYTLSGCGWQSLYRLDARPEAKTVHFSWEAEIWQSSGQNWSQVEINIATLSPLPAISPPELSPWIIKPRLPFPHKEKQRMDMAEGETMAAAAAIEAPLPQQERKSTFTLWKLGKMHVPAGARQIVKIMEASWPAEFIHLARPAIGSQVFVRASVILPELEEIPSGSTIYMIDGAMLGKRTFSLAGKESTIFFGIDPLVTVASRLLSQKSGEKTFLAGKRTYEWDWRIEIDNNRTSPIRIRVEEPKPQVRDERILLTVKSVPPASEDDEALLIWAVDAPAAQKSLIRNTVRIEAPKDIDLDLGWRR